MELFDGTSPFDSLRSLRALDSKYRLPARVRPCGLPRASGASRVAPRVGLEPTTLRLTVECSTIELPGKVLGWKYKKPHFGGP